MADDVQPAKTEYRVLRRLTEEELTGPLAAGPLADAEVYVLTPKTYTGNVKRAVYEELGEGDYIKVAARSLDPFPVRTKSVVSFKSE